MKKLLFTLLVSITLLSSCSTSGKNDEKEVNVYTSRHYEVDKAIFKEFEKKTGIKVNVVELDSPELFAKIQSEKAAVADVVMMTGAEYIYKFNELDLLIPHNLKPNMNRAYYGDNWAGFAGRTRSVALKKDSSINIASYDDLAKEVFINELLVRSSSNSYNQAWIAAMIESKGEEYTRAWLNSFVNNFSRTPEGNDRDQVKAINADLGDIAILNSYYMNRLHTSSEANEVAASKNVTLANLNEIHLNISWAGLLDKHDSSVKLLEYYLSSEVQTKISMENGEYPLNYSAKTNSYIADLQDVNPQPTNYEEFGKNIEKAYEMMLEAGWK